VNKQLNRNVKNGAIGGVCAGLADYTGIDVSFIRIMFIFGSFFIGLFILLYIIMWLVVPEN